MSVTVGERREVERTDAREIIDASETKAAEIDAGNERSKVANQDRSVTVANESTTTKERRCTSGEH